MHKLKRLSESVIPNINQYSTTCNMRQRARLTLVRLSNNFNKELHLYKTQSRLQVSTISKLLLPLFAYCKGEGTGAFTGLGKQNVASHKKVSSPWPRHS